MEQNNSWVFVVVILIFASVFGYVIYSKLKRRKASWTGVVIDKNVTESVNNNYGRSEGSGITFGNTRAVNRSYRIRVRSDSGEEFSWPVGQGFYESVQVGDRLTKSPGTETPVKQEVPSNTPQNTF